MDVLPFAAAALIVVGAWLLRGRGACRTRSDPGAVLLFRDGALVEASAAGIALLPGAARDLDAAVAALRLAWPGLASWLAGPGMPAELLPREGVGPPLMAERLGGAVRLSIDVPSLPRRAPWAGDGRVGLDADALRRMEDELIDLRGLVARLPFPIWRPAGEAGVEWGNEAHMRWPAVAAALAPEASARILAGGAPVTAADAGGNAWEFRNAGDGVLIALPVRGGAAHGKAPVGRLLDALPLGIGRIGPDGRIAGANAAFRRLVGRGHDDPTDLRLGDALAPLRARGLLHAEDALHALIGGLEAAAASDDAPLPAPMICDFADGDVWRLGAVREEGGGLALIVEDLSDHVAELRGLRAQIAAAEGALDLLDVPVAGFAAGGGAVIANAAYRDRHGHDPVAHLEGGLVSCEAGWAARFGGAAAAARLTGALTEGRRADMPLHDARAGPVLARCAPLPGGGAAVAFLPGAAQGAAVPRKIAAE